jgi:hypothetical protein
MKRYSFRKNSWAGVLFYVVLLGEKLKNGSEYRFQYLFHPLGAKTVDGAEIRTLSSGDPHEHDIFTDGFGNLTGGVDSLCVGIDDNFCEHFGMVTVSAPPG